MYKKPIMILVCIILIFTSYNVYADQQSSLQSQQNQVQSEINAIQREIKEKEASKTPYLEKKKTLDAKLNAANSIALS